jgi:5'-nucleotidase
LNLLLSNDDGILARGLEVLADVCRSVASITVVAPDREQSGSSHSLTLDRPLRVTRKPDGGIQVDGTPTDCVLLALGELLEQKPDFVFSGINHGPNMGEDVLYSGTVAAAMEGLPFGVPGVAFSLAGDRIDLLDTHRPWLERIVRNLLQVSEFPRDTLLNINLPAIPGDEIQGIRVTTLGNRAYSDALLRTSDPWGRPGYWIGGGQISWWGREDSDFRAIQEGFVSVTPLHLDLTNYSLLETVRTWSLGE